MLSEESKEFIKYRTDQEDAEAFKAMPFEERLARRQPRDPRKRSNQIKERDPHDYS